MIGVTGGCEPEFAIKYNRKTDNLKDSYDVYCNEAKYYMTKLGTNTLPECFVCSSDINWRDRVDMQSIMQEHVDTAISSTVNLPNEITLDEVEQLYLYAWQKGLKGITVYRDGCKRSGILTTDKTKKNNDSNQEESVKYNYISPVSRKTIGTTYGNTYCKKTACGTSYITINKDRDGNVVECFVNTSKGGICKSNIDGLNRMISLCLRSGVKIDEIIDQLSGITCQACVKMKTKGEVLDGLSCPDTICRTLREFMLEDNINNSMLKTTNVQSPKDTSSPRCPECGAKLRFEGGCSICVGDEEHVGCGWSKCN